MPRLRTAAQQGFTTPLHADDARWISECAEQRRCSLNEVVHSLVDDQRTLYRLPPLTVQQLDADRGARSVKQYLIDLLTTLYGELIEPRCRRRRNAQP